MSTTYTASLRGKLVSVPRGTSTRIYSAPNAASKTVDFVTGPETVGMATGNVTVDSSLAWMEVIRVVSSPLLMLPTKIYLLRDGLNLSTNPSYDPAKDLDRPADNGGTPGQTGEDYDTGSIGEIVIIKQKKTTPSVVPIPDGSARSREWLKYGLYALLGLAVITIVVLIAKPASSVDTNQSIQSRRPKR